MYMCNLVVTLFFLLVLDSSQVAKDAINRVLEVCKQWNSEPPCLHKSKMKYESYVHAIKNTRRKMEDRHVLVPHFNSLFGFSQVIFFTKYAGRDLKNLSHCLISGCNNNLFSLSLSLLDFMNVSGSYCIARLQITVGHWTIYCPLKFRFWPAKS